MSSVSSGPWEFSGPVRSRKAADVSSVETMAHESRGTKGNAEATRGEINRAEARTF